jgi:hypothetical protein
MKHNFTCIGFSLSMVLAVLSWDTAAGQKLDTEKLKEMKARSIGPAGMSGRVTSVEAVASNPSIIYVGTASGGVWKSTSGGTHGSPYLTMRKS